MSKVRKEIVEWLQCQQYWLQRVAEKVLKHEAITDEVIDTLIALLKTEEAQSKDTPIDFSFLDESNEEHSKILIKSIGDICGIDNIASRAPLEFGRNLTVIYGHNGSGKSGYTRIIKKACGKITLWNYVQMYFYQSLWNKNVPLLLRLMVIHKLMNGMPTKLRSGTLKV